MTKVDVRWIYHRQEGKDAAQRPALCFHGQNHAMCVVSGHTVHVLKRPLAAVQRARPVLNQMDQQPYPPHVAVERLRDIATRLGLTDSARRLLDAFDKHGCSYEVQDDSFTDEEISAMERPDEQVPDGENDSPAPATSDEKKSDDTSTGKGDTNVSTKKAKAPAKKAAAKAAPAKAPAKQAAKAAPAKQRVTHAKLPKTKGEGPTPFRPGTAKEKAFLLYKDNADKYAAMSKEAKGEWSEKQAGKLGISAGTLRSWISGQFTVALRK